jgi:hypothetical protein
MALHIGVVGEASARRGSPATPSGSAPRSRAPGAVLRVLLERVLKSEYLVFFGQL